MDKKYCLYNESCMDAMKRIETDSIDLVLTDPPYNLGLFMKKRATNLKTMRDNFFGAAGWDNLEFDEWEKDMDAMFAELARIIKPRGSAIMFMSIIKVESIIKDLLSKMNLDTEDFSFSLAEVPFDINDESTWGEGLIPVAKLFYYFVEDLVSKSNIAAEEVENLKTKEYTKSLFHATDYPAIANNRNDNMGNSTQKRYRAKALRFNGIDIYISTQFFDSDRDAVIEWYKSHNK